MSGRQLLLILSGLFTGVLLESLYDVPKELIIITLTGSLFGAILWRRFSLLQLLVVSLGLVLLCTGILRTQWYESQFIGSPLETELGQQVSLVGVVSKEPDVRANFTQLFVTTDTDTVLVRVDRFTIVAYGDEITVRGKLERPEAFVTDTNRTFDYPNYLLVRKVQYVVSFAAIEVVSNNNGNPLAAGLYAAKAKFVATLERAIPAPEVSLGVGLLLGVKQALGDELETAFRQTGIIHIVVLSGYNVMLVVGFFWWLSSWFFPIKGRIVFGLIGITLFALLVGLSATVVRASIMAGVLLVGTWLGRLYDVLRALLFAAAIMVIINPYILLYDIGFQLSFMATLGLVVVLPQFESTVATHASSLKLTDLFKATLVTQLFVLPLLMYNIGEVSVVSVIVNMLVLPVVPIAMLATFITGLVGLVSDPLASLFGLVAQLPLMYINAVALWFARLPFAAVIVPPVSVGVLLLMYFVPAGLLFLWQRLHSNTNHDQLTDWTVVIENDTKTATDGESVAVSTPVIFR